MKAIATSAAIALVMLSENVLASGCGLGPTAPPCAVSEPALLGLLAIAGVAVAARKLLNK